MCKEAMFPAEEELEQRAATGLVTCDLRRKGILRQEVVSVHR